MALNLESLKNMADSALQTASETAKKIADEASEALEQYTENQSNKTDNASNETKFCTNCGTRIDANARFCPGCGNKIGSENDSAEASAPVETNSNENPANRQQEFAGIILKCPNCGQPINHTDVVCPGCGCQIIGRAASSSVQQFQKQLMDIENSRGPNTSIKSIITSFTGEDKTETDIANRKITLIKSFPIPNTIEEITEFIILAASNIDVNLSKKSIGNKWGRLGNDYKANERGISDAWVGKLQQAYQKAELSFSDIPIFEKVKDIYTKKMNELNMLEY